MLQFGSDLEDGNQALLPAWFKFNSKSSPYVKNSMNVLHFPKAPKMQN